MIKWNPLLLLCYILFLKKRNPKKTSCCLLLCSWTCGISISLSHFMCCRPDPCPPIKVICGLECNCNVKNKSAQQSTSCLVIGFFLTATVRMLLTTSVQRFREGSKQQVLFIWVKLRSPLPNCSQGYWKHTEPVMKPMLRLWFYFGVVYLIFSFAENCKQIPYSI